MIRLNPEWRDLIDGPGMLPRTIQGCSELDRAHTRATDAGFIGAIGPVGGK